MIAFVLLAHLWGLFQLHVIGSLSRSLRWRVLVLSLMCALYACSVGALGLQQAWIRPYAALTGQRVYDVTAFAAYTLDPVIKAAEVAGRLGRG
jgi:hypothetical protein